MIQVLKLEYIGRYKIRGSLLGNPIPTRAIETSPYRPGNLYSGTHSTRVCALSSAIFTRAIVKPVSQAGTELNPAASGVKALYYEVLDAPIGSALIF